MPETTPAAAKAAASVDLSASANPDAEKGPTVPAAPASTEPAFVVLTDDFRGLGFAGRVAQADAVSAAELVQRGDARPATTDEVERAYPILKLEA